MPGSPQPGQHPGTWLAQALDDIGAVVVTHAGNYRYAWAIGTRAQRRRCRIVADPRPYPKRGDG